MWLPQTVALRAESLTPLFPLDPVVLGLSAVGLRDRHAVHAQRAPDEDAVAWKPGVLAPPAVDGSAAGPEDLERFALVEDVLLQLRPVIVAPQQHARHERVEVGRAGWSGLGRTRAARGRTDHDGTHGKQETKVHVGPRRAGARVDEPTRAAVPPAPRAGSYLDELASPSAAPPVSNDEPANT